MSFFTRSYIVAVLVFIVLLIITVVSYWKIKSKIMARNKEVFEARVLQAQNSIERRINSYVLMLKASKGLFNVSDTVTREDWQKFVESLNIYSYPGLQGIGYAQYLQKDEIDNHIEQVRASGFPYYNVMPEHPRETYFPIIYLEPFRGRNLKAFGYDMYSDPTRRKAMNIARDSNMASITSAVKLVQETGHDLQPGFLIYLPVYKNGKNPQTVEERRSLIKGFVYNPIRVHNFINAIFKSNNTDFNLLIFDGDKLTKENLIYSDDSNVDLSEDNSSPLTILVKLDFNGQLWSLKFTAKDNFISSSDKFQPYLILISGLLISSLIFVLLLSLFNIHEADYLKQIITDNATAALFMIDKNGYCTFMNPAAEEMTGFTFDEIIEKPLHDMIHHHYPDGSDYPREKCPINTALFSKKNIRSHEDLFFRKDGSSFSVTCAARPVFQNSVPIATVLEVRDITNDKKAQKLLKEHTDNLRDKNTELEQKNKELSKINNDLDSFIYTASHDLKSPISNIEGLVTLLAKKIGNKLETSDNRILEHINQSILKFKRTIGDLTEIAKVQKNLEKELKVISFHQILEEVTSEMSNQFSEAQATLNFDFQVEEIRYSWIELRSILYNLISNAIKYRSPDRFPSIKICTKKEDEYTLLTFQDNGLGIASDQIHKMFAMFKRLHTHIEGSGVGLYIVKRIVENNGGKIEVESELGKGTKFKVYLKSL